MSTPSIRVRHESRFRPVEAGAFRILLRVSAPEVVRHERQRPPLDLAFVVDRSGSMGGGPFELARQGVEHALRLLNERDTASVVVYDDRIDTLLSQRPLDHDAHDKAVRRLQRVRPRGSTDLAGGWLTGCDQLAPIADGTLSVREGGPRSIVRALLLSDGLANVGMTDSHEIARHAAELAARGITTSTFGVGDHYDEELLARMADSGRGHFHHIADATLIPTVFAGELGEMLEMAMRDVVLTIRWPDGWGASLMNDLPYERVDGAVRMSLGEMESRATRSMVWELGLPGSEHGRRDEVEIRLTWRDAVSDEERSTTYLHPIETNHVPGVQDTEVLDEVAHLMGARAKAEAVALNKMGRYDQAESVIRHAAMAMPRTATGQSVARELLEDVAPSMAFAASPADLKRHYANSRTVQRSRKDYAKPVDKT